MKTKQQLNGKQKKFLRRLGHHLDHSVIVGREGLSDNLLLSLEDTILAHELIKVKLGQNCPLDKKEAADLLASKTGAHLVQLIGKTVLLYKSNSEKNKDEKIRLPGGNR